MRSDKCDWEQATENFLSLKLSSMYLPSFFASLAQDSVGIKALSAAAVTVIISFTGAYSVIFFVVVAFWMGDMLFGSLRALKDPKERWLWTKAGDGLLRLIVICVLPGLAALVELIPSQLFPVLDLEFKLVTITLSVLAVHEFISLTGNAAALHPAARKIQARLIRWQPDDGTIISDRSIEVALIDSQDEEE